MQTSYKSGIQNNKRFKKYERNINSQTLQIHVAKICKQPVKDWIYFPANVSSTGDLPEQVLELGIIL